MHIAFEESRRRSDPHVYMQNGFSVCYWCDSPRNAELHVEFDKHDFKLWEEVVQYFPGEELCGYRQYGQVCGNHRAEHE